MDATGAALGLLLLSPVLAVIAVAIKLDSRGPVFFRQARLGRRMEEFTVMKFRTMKFDASPELHRAYIAKLAAGQADEDELKKLTKDPRVTRVGALLRRTSLDELPQLINVLRGDMSLVGPRPLPERDFARLEEWHKKRYLVMPGMTGLWQVSGRSELDFDELVRLDFLYLERWSVFLDLSILLKTVPAVLMRKGAF